MSTRVHYFLGILLLWGAIVTFPGLTLGQAPGGEEAAPAAAATPADSAKPEEVQRESGIHWFLRCSGLIGLFIFGLSVYFVALVIRMFMTLKPDVVVPMEVAGQFREVLGQGNFQGAYEIVRSSDSFLGRVLAKGIEHLPNGLPEARHAMERTADAETVRMEKQISMMAVLGTLGPMIGLIGTLKGMISSFSVIAMGGVTLKASEVANGISEALLLTFEGVSLSVPAIYFFALFRNRIATMSTDAMLEAEDLLHLFFRSGRPKPGAAPAAPAGHGSPMR